jgi:ubiquinone/menaquinone biosynthesis C-methylase UbiE
MRQDERPPFVQALQRARITSYGPDEFVGQESFMRAHEIISLARQAGVRAGIRVLDLCCGIAGPGRHIAAELGCDYLGVDYSPSAIDIARASAEGLPCNFEVAHVPPIPSGHFDVVMLLETMLAFEDKTALLAEVSRVLPAGGRLALTLEAGRPLTAAESRAMPDPDTVWLVPLPEMIKLLCQAGLRVTWQQNCSESHRMMAETLLHAFAGEEEAIAAQIGQHAMDELVAAHRLWADWLGSGRVSKFAMVAEKI